MLENFPRFARCLKFSDFRHRERQTCRKHWVHTALDLVPTFCAGCFSKSTVIAFSSFSEGRLLEFCQTQVLYCIYFSLWLELLGSAPTTRDPNTSAKVWRYKLEPHRDTNWWCIYYFCQEESILLQIIAIQMGGVSRYFSTVSGSGVDVTLLNYSPMTCSAKIITDSIPGRSTSVSVIFIYCLGDENLYLSSRIQLPFMTLNPQEWTAENALSCRKMQFFVGHMAGNRRKLQESFRAQESRTLANFHKNLQCLQPLGIQVEDGADLLQFLEIDLRVGKST